MAPTKPSSKAPRTSKGGSKGPAPGVSKKGAKGGKAPPPKQQKTKPKSAGPDKKKKKRVYTEAELGIPKLNMITPVGVQKPRGKKKGKVFVDDAHTMQTILAMVNAEKEGQIESKMMKARQMEEIREARQNEQNAKEAQRKNMLESKKDELRKKRKKSGGDTDDVPEKRATNTKFKKRVSFG
jgi:60S ribosomal subunit assembly/export protein LOC1